jgi:hypothetical protein
VTNERAVAVWRALFIIGFVNFLVCAAVGFVIGGDAVAGHRAEGHFYVADHGKLTEVSEAVWLYSRAHVFSLWVTQPVALVALVMHHRTRRRGKVAVGRKWV